MTSNRTPAPDAELARRVRRPLAVIAVVGYPVAVTCWAVAYGVLGVPPAVAGVVGLLAILITLFAIRRVYQFRARLAQAPDAQLDERQLQIRDRAYVESYRIFAAITIVTLLLVGIVPDLLHQPLTFDYSVANLFVMGAVILSLGLPSAVVAWREPDVAD